MISNSVEISGSLQGIPAFHYGRKFFVGNSSTRAQLLPKATRGANTNNRGTEPEHPWSTVAYAVSKCSAGRGDIIYLNPYHAENIGSAAALALNVVGVKVVGLGVGAAQAALTWTATASTMTVTAADCSLTNLLLDFTGIDAVVTALVISAVNFKMYDCRVITATAAAQCTRAIVASTADGLGIYRCRFEGSADTGTASAIKVTGDTLDPRGFEFYNNVFNGFYTTSCFEFVTTGPKNVRMVENQITSTATGVAVVVTWVGTETGQLVRNRVKLVAGEGIQPFSATPATVALHDNTCVDGSGENGAAVLGAGTST